MKILNKILYYDSHEFDVFNEVVAFILIVLMVIICTV